MTGWRRHLGICTAVALVAAASPARATATLTCDVDGREFAFHVQAAVGHEALTLSGLRGELRLPKEAIAVELGSEELMQFWIEGEDLRLRFHVFAEGDKPDIDLVVVTRSKGPTDYRGTYRLRIGDGATARRRRGDIGCAVG
mgnify:CR=1 FL=1